MSAPVDPSFRAGRTNHRPGGGRASTLFLAFLAPLAVAAGLIVFRNVYLTFFLYQGLCCIAIPAADLLLARKLRFREIHSAIGLNCGRGAAMQGLIWGSVFFLSILLFFSVFRGAFVQPDRIRALLSVWGVRESHGAALSFLMVVLNPTLEEIYWRGYLFERLSGHFHPRVVIVISSLFYASYHCITTGTLFGFQAALWLTAVIFFAGVCWGRLRSRTDSVWGPVISHFMADLAVMTAYLIFVRGPSGSA